MKSLTNKVYYQKSKVASFVAQNEELKQKVRDTQKVAAKQEEQFALANKRQEQFIERANKSSQKASKSVCYNSLFSRIIKSLTSFLGVS